MVFIEIIFLICIWDFGRIKFFGRRGYFIKRRMFVLFLVFVVWGRGSWSGWEGWGGERRFALFGVRGSYVLLNWVIDFSDIIFLFLVREFY